MAQDPRYGATATRILERIEEGEEAATSTLVIAQVCSYLRWGKREEVIPIYLGFLRSLPNLVKVDTIFEDLVEAVEMSRKLDLGWRTWDDLVIAAQMARMGVMEIYSNDRDFDEILGVKRIFD